MPKQRPSQEALGYLLDFDGFVYCYEGGYEVVFKIVAVDPSPGQPEGVDYAFTLHAPGTGGGLGPRILGMDNAHSPDKANPWDHYHPPKRGRGSGSNSIPKAGDPVRLREPSIVAAFDRFHVEVEKTLEGLGISTSPISQTTKSEVQQRMSASRNHRSKGARK